MNAEDDGASHRAADAIRIFVVDPDSLARVATEHVLTANGYEVMSAATSESTPQLVRSFDPAAIVVSGVAPHEATCDFVHGLRAGGVGTAIMVLGDAAGVRERVDALDAGADDCMPSPVAVDEFLMRLRALVRRTSQFRAAG